MNPVRILPLLTCFITLFCLSSPAAQALEADPVLRIEAGMHVGELDSAVFDRTGRTLLTSAADKTARLWQVQEGRQIAVLRPPSNNGAGGNVTAIALSPDGQKAAVAISGAEYNLFIFDGNGVLQKTARVAGEIKAMVYTDDGRWLVTGGSSGLQRLQADTLETVKLAGKYTYKIAVSNQTALYVGSQSESEEVFACKLDQSEPCRRIFATPKGYITGNLALSPDARLTYLSIRHFYSNVPDTVKPYAATLLTDSGALLRSVEGLDGKLLWSGDGRAWLLRGAALFRFDVEKLEAGPGSARASGYTTAAAVSNGKLLFLRKNGESVNIASVNANGGDVQTGVAVAQIPPEADRQAAYRMAVLEQRGIHFLPHPQGDGCFYVQIDNGDNKPERIKNSRRCQNTLGLDDGGLIYSRFNELRRYAFDGSVLWRTPYAGNITLGMVLSSDGRWVGIRCEDGLFRVMSASSGKEMLAVYQQGERWVMATPLGLYDASPAGEELIGWQINRGAQQAADFFPASRFRQKFNRPDVISKIFETGSEQEALAKANEEAGRKLQTPSIAQILPPVIRILAPNQGARISSNRVTLRVSIQSSADAPLTGVRARINGQALAADNLSLGANGKPATPGEPGQREITLTVPAQDSDIQLFAENRHGVSSPASLRLSWQGNTPQEFSVKPKLYVLAVGISDYDNPAYKLGLAAKDAQDFGKVMQQQKGRLYRDVEVRLLLNHQASRDEVLDGLDWLRKQVTAKDMGMLFLAGHGYNDADGVYYFMPANIDADKLKRTGVVFSEIKNTMANLAGKALFFLDTCHSGNVLGGRRALGNDITNVINELASAENGVVVFSSSTGRQYSLENAAWGNGAFTKALVEGLGGKADLNKNGRITFKMLDFYLSERVKELTKGQQTPVTQAPGGVPDFPVALTP